MSTPSIAYERALAQILSSQEQIFGAGVAIDDRRVLSCAHVVARSLGLPPNATKEQIVGREGPWIRRPYLSGRDAKPTKMRVVDFWSRGEKGELSDLALLETVDGRFARAPDRDASPPEFDSRGPSPGDELFIRGFPADRQASRAQTDEAYYEALNATDYGLVNAMARRGFGSEVRGGFSGGPVWSERTRAVVGLVSEGDSERRTAVIIPVETLRKIVPLPRFSRDREGQAEAAAQASRAITKPGPLRLLLDWLVPGLHLWLTTVVGFFEDPPERTAISDELQSMAAQFEHGLIQKTYLPPPARLADPAPGEFRPLRQIIRAIKPLSTGGDAATANISALSKRSARVRKLVDLIQRSPVPIILLGEPGSGKSMTLQQAAIGIARINERRVFPKYCLFIPLGRWKPDLSPTGPDERTVEGLVISMCPPAVRPYLEALQKSSRLIVIFDGMDEMSRERYVEHTAALDKYANKVRNWVRTLFSCRLADFSPNFQHRRLVLLPFDERHVREYLSRQLDSRDIAVDGHKLTAKRLASQLVSDELSIQANNPYVLYLLCLYIRETGSLPLKRCDLLEYYYRFNFERKHSGDELAPSDITRAFALWGEIALEITIRNRGSEMRSTEIERLLGADAESAIATALRTGALVRSTTADTDSAYTLHFENHRAQEFFSAWAIAHTERFFDWSGLLDAPRWQETLVNVAQLGAASVAIDTLIQTMESTAAPDPESTASAGRVFAIADAAERVDLAARVARDLPASDARTHLLEAVRRATQSFLTSDNAYSKIVMLRVLQRTPEIGSIGMIEPALTDKAQWVREQAHIVASQMAGSFSRAPLAAELALSYANWQLLSRAFSYLQLAKKLKSIRLAGVVLIGVLMLLLQAFAFAAVGPALTAATVKAADHALESLDFRIERIAVDPYTSARLRALAKDIVSRETSGEKTAHAVVHDIESVKGYAPWISLAVSILVLIYVLLAEPLRAWLYLPVAGIVTTFGPVLLDAFWHGAQSLTVLLAIGIGSGLFVAGNIIALVLAASGFATWALTTGLFAAGIGALTYSARNAMAAWRTAMAATDFGAVAWVAFAAVWPLLAVSVFSILAFIIADGGLHFITIGFLDRPGNAIVNLATGLLIVASIGVIAWKIAVWRLGQILPTIGTLAGFTIAVSFLLIAPRVLIVFISQLFDRYFHVPPSAETFLFKAVVVLAAIVVMIPLLVIAATVGRRAVKIAIQQIERLRRSPIDPIKWEAEIRKAGPGEQAHLLSLADPERFGLSLEQTLTLLIGLDDMIDLDPALSAYQAKMTELLTQRRQRRAGNITRR